MPHVAIIRQTQAVAALQALLALKPNRDTEQVTHFLLANVYQNAPGGWYFEAKVRHLNEYLRLGRRTGRLPLYPPGPFQEQLEHLEGVVKEAERERQTKLDRYELSAATKPVLEKARLALQNGLAETAVSLLVATGQNEDTRQELYDRNNPRYAPGLALLVELLLGLGRLHDARDAMVPDDPADDRARREQYGQHRIGMPAYDWLRIQLAAAAGDYADADRFLGRIAEETAKDAHGNLLLEQMGILPPGKSKPLDRGGLAGGAVAAILLRTAPVASGASHRLMLAQPLMWQMVLGHTSDVCAELLRQEADLRTLRGWLALEAGDIATARAELEHALRLGDAGPAPGGGRFLRSMRCQPLAALCLERIERGEKKKP
jgi:hypothetical protein